VDALNEDGYSKKFIANLPKRVRPSLKQYTQQKEILLNHRDLYHTDDEDYEKLPELNEELED
jgi:hypothetical protein